MQFQYLEMHFYWFSLRSSSSMFQDKAEMKALRKQVGFS